MSLFYRRQKICILQSVVDIEWMEGANSPIQAFLIEVGMGSKSHDLQGDPRTVSIIFWVVVRQNFYNRDEF